MTVDFSKPPIGFIIEDKNGNLLIKYRRLRIVDVGDKIYWSVIIMTLTFACVYIIFDALTSPDGIQYELILFSIPFWAGEFFLIGILIWEYGSIISCELSQEKLMVSRTCLSYKREYEILRNQITKIRQVNDGGTKDSLKSFGVVVNADKKYKILYEVGIEKSDWLGLLFSKWSGKDYLSWQDESKDVEQI